MSIISIGVTFLVLSCFTDGAISGPFVQSMSVKELPQISTDCPNDCFDHCLSIYGGRLSKGKTYYCQKGCAAMRGGRVTYPNRFCCNPNFDTCKQSCQRASRHQSNIRICENGCTFWKKNQDITATCDCPNDCFDHCWRRYGGTLLKGNMYYCQKGCAGLKGGQVIHSDRYCCTRNFETCKENCQRASSSRANIERCEYGCTFWKENPSIPERCATCDDGIKNQGETDVDCGGPCSACPTCNDGIQNQGETGVDCGGPCTACPTCNDSIQNQGETGVDCGGSCTACPTCNDGIQNQGESGVDCGSPCTACPTCDDDIENQGETGVDCGGPCTACPTCNDGIQNQGETGVDCGGQCTACQASVPDFFEGDYSYCFANCSSGIRNAAPGGEDLQQKYYADKNQFIVCNEEMGGLYKESSWSVRPISIPLKGGASIEGAKTVAVLVKHGQGDSGQTREFMLGKALILNSNPYPNARAVFKKCGPIAREQVLEVDNMFSSTKFVLMVLRNGEQGSAMFRNGIKVASFDCTTPIPSQNYMFLGANHFAGTFKSFAMWNRELSDDEIAALDQTKLTC